VLVSVELGRTRVTSADLVRHFGRWQEQAAIQPVYVTHHGRDRQVLLSIAAYAALRTRAAMPAGKGGPVLEPMLEQLSDGFIAVDRELRLTQINPAGAAYLQLTRTAALNRRLVDAVAAFEGSLLLGHLARAGAAGEIMACEGPSPVYTGRWLSFRVFPYGEGAACLRRDVTDWIEAGRQARQDAATVAAMAAHGGIGRARLSPRGTFVAVDAALAEMAGFAADCLIRARLTDILPLNRRVAASDELEQVLTGGQARAFDSALLVNKGEEAMVRIALAPLGREGEARGAVAIVTRDSGGASDSAVDQF